MSDNYIEIVNPGSGGREIKSVLFDFDGTISVIREGWPEIMIPLMMEILSEAPNCEPAEELEAFVKELVDQTTGIDTIYQMMKLAEEVEKRGKAPLDAADYKKEYLRRLWERIEHRVESLNSGKTTPEQLSMVGAIDFLEELTRRGLKLYLASGTDHANVVQEAEALGVAKYFGEHIYGALDNYWERSKAKVIQDLLAKNNLQGDNLLTFGDGFVEIENCKEVGGLAVGVASDELKRCGMNEKKRGRLIKAGADAIIPDFSDIPTLCGYLFKG